jgi:glycosyltransferase involved in cell wall biosynthesis
MRIAILHYAGPPIVGGVEITIQHHARLLARVGHDVCVIAGRGDHFYPQVAFHHIAEVDSRHPDVLEVGEALARGELPNTFRVLCDRLVERLYPLLEESDVCIVHNAVTLHKNLPLTAALYRLAERGIVPFVAWCHDFAWQDALYAPDLHLGHPWDLLRTTWPNVCYVVVSEHRRECLARLLGLAEESIRVIHPGVDVNEFLKLEPATQRLVSELNLLDAEPLLLLPARITRRKNIQFALRIMGALLDHMPRATLLITGPPGPHNPKNVAYLRSLQALKENLGLAQQVYFLYEYGEGERPLHVSDAMMGDLYRLADGMLFPSQREGFGIPVLEAGLVRLPIFAARIPSIERSVGDLAYLFELDDEPADIAAAIAGHLNSEDSYLLRRRVLGAYTWRAILERDLIPLLEEVMERNG